MLLRVRVAGVAMLCGATVGGAIAGVASSPAAAAKVSGTSLRAQSALADAIVLEINRVRAQHGLARVARSPQLAAAARQHSDEMTTMGYFAHTSRDGTALETRVKRYFPATNYRWWSVGETLLWSSPGIGAAAAVQAWLQSPEHRRILLDGTWRQIGLSAVHDNSAPGVYGAREVTVITADFGARTR
jgi:uncharacterized protein YkwD